LALIAWFVMSLREMGEPAQQRHARFARDLRAVWVGAVLFWLAWMSGAVGATLLFGIVSFLALREFITLMHTRRGDHRGLLLAFFVVLPLQFTLAGGRWFDLFTVFIPVYVFLAIPVVSALAGDPARFLERNAKIQWGIMVCVYGLSHAPALLLLEFPNFAGAPVRSYCSFWWLSLPARRSRRKLPAVDCAQCPPRATSIAASPRGRGGSA
jgi:phosphatidate cytidylyltransferase